MTITLSLISESGNFEPLKPGQATLTELKNDSSFDQETYKVFFLPLSEGKGAYTKEQIRETLFLIEKLNYHEIILILTGELHRWRRSLADPALSCDLRNHETARISQHVNQKRMQDFQAEIENFLTKTESKVKITWKTTQEILNETPKQKEYEKLIKLLYKDKKKHKISENSTTESDTSSSDSDQELSNSEKTKFDPIFHSLVDQRVKEFQKGLDKHTPKDAKTINFVKESTLVDNTNKIFASYDSDSIAEVDLKRDIKKSVNYVLEELTLIYCLRDYTHIAFSTKPAIDITMAYPFAKNPSHDNPGIMLKCIMRICPSTQDWHLGNLDFDKPKSQYKLKDAANKKISGDSLDQQQPENLENPPSESVDLILGNAAFIIAASNLTTHQMICAFNSVTKQVKSVYGAKEKPSSGGFFDRAHSNSDCTTAEKTELASISKSP